MRVDGKVALVTGGGQGIGRTIAVKLAEAGADVAIIDVNQEVAEEAAEAVRQAGQKAIALKADVTSMSEAEAVCKSHGRSPWHRGYTR